MVPEGWKTGQITDLLKSLDSGVSVNSEDDGNVSAPYKILKTSCVSAGVFKVNETKSVLDENEVCRLKEPVNDNSIIISRMNTPALVGANGYVENAPPNTFLPDRLWQAKPINEQVVMRWLAYWFASSHTRHMLSALGTGTSGSMKNITKGDVLNSKILIPPISEQKKIARILSTWDKAIATTEQLLANSQQQKKALMQQLLTGKKRLLDEDGVRFSGEWKTTHLSEICLINPKKQGEPNGGLVSFIGMDGVTENGRLKYTTIKHYSDVSKGFTSFINNDILVAKITPCFENGKGAYAYDLINGIGFGSTEFHVLRATKHSNSKYLYYLTNTTEFRVRGEANMQGSAGQKRVTTNYLKQFNVKVPPSVKEQEKIADLLWQVDEELYILEAKVTKLKQEKKALMQQLLTGKRRVKVDKEAAA